MLKTDRVTVPDWGGRDAGKVFVLTEWPAGRAEKWGMRMMMSMRSSGAGIPMGVEGLSMIDVAILGINAFLQADIDPDVLIPLLDELLDCAKIVRDPHHPEAAVEPAWDVDVQEVKTRLWLRSEVFKLHTGFSAADALFRLAGASARGSGSPG